MAATLVLRLTGGSTNTDPNASLGGVMSSTELQDGQLNNLYDNVSPEEASSGMTDYRALDVYNAGDATSTSVSLFLSSETPSGDTSIDLGYDSANSPHASDASLPTIADETTEPTDGTNPISFDHYTSANKLSLPDIPAGEAVRIWVKRIVNAGATNMSGDNFTIRVDFA